MGSAVLYGDIVVWYNVSLTEPITTIHNLTVNFVHYSPKHLTPATL